MAGAREIRKRIRSVANIAQITKAMELVAASRMRQAQEVAVSGHRYNNTLDEMLVNLLPHAEPERHVLLRHEIEGDTRPSLMLVFAPDKGLCGALPTNLLREVMRFKQKYSDVHFMTMGKKARDIARKAGGQVVADVPLREKPHLMDVSILSQMAVDEFSKGTYARVLIANTRFINTLKQQAQVVQLLPLSPELLNQVGVDIEDETAEHDYVFEPGVDSVLASLLPRFIEMSIFQALLDSLASEYSARMIAMKNAGDNAKDLGQELTLTYNQLRQASITAELAEISSAASV